MPSRPNGGSYSTATEDQRRQAHLTPGAHVGMPATSFKLYISGPITGIEDDNRGSFLAAQMRLEASGYEAINPHDIGAQSGYQDGLRWSDYLRADLVYILTEGVQGIATIDGHHHSRGATLECHLASELDIPVGPEEFWISIAKGINQ